MKNNLKEKWDKECEEAMKPNQIEKEILEKFDKKFNNIDVNECEYNDDGEPDNMVIIDSEGLRRNGLKSVRQFISDSLSTYRTQVEKETKQDINKITNRIMNWMQEFGVEMSLLGIVLPKELDDVKGVCKAIKESNGDWWRKYSEEEYKRGKRETLQEVKDKMPKELEWKSRDRCEVCINYNCGYCSNCMRTVFDHPRDMSDIDKGFNEYRSQMLEIIEKLK